MTPTWAAYFTTHGDPLVVTDATRPHFTTVATVCTAPDDYGRANALLLASAPALLDIVRALMDDEPCRYDHHRYCQTHSIAAEPCPHELAHDLLRHLPQETP
jgi:hypothetical protein